MLSQKPKPSAGDAGSGKNVGKLAARNRVLPQTATPLQADLFGAVASAPSDPLLDLVVTLPDACKCGAAEAVIGAGRGPHLASLRCCACEAHRGWLGHQTHSFLTKTVTQFGRPSEPVAIRRARDIGFISSPDLTILPRDRVPLAIDALEVTAESNPNGDEKCR
jgi:hypothetical protein